MIIVQKVHGRYQEERESNHMLYFTILSDDLEKLLKVLGV